ncbi:MAG: PAS domain-containing protein, partial [Cycloclasticus sp.]
MDISTKTQPFSDLQSELDLQRFALKCSGNFIWVCDLASGAINTFGDTERFFNDIITNNQVSLDHWVANIHEDDRAETNDKYRQLIKGEISHYNHSYRLKHKDGTWIWFNTSAGVYERHPGGKVKTLVGYNSIIHRKNHLEDEANEHISQLSFAMLSTKSSLFDFDITKQTIKQLTFEQTAQGISTVIREIALAEGLPTVHPNENQANLDFFNSFSDGTGELKEAMWRSNYRNDEYRWQKAQGRVVSFDDNGKPLRAVGIRQDVHNEHMIELHANQAQERDSQ